MNQPPIKIFIGIVTLCFGFYAGMKWQQFRYLDTCLDLGGGMNPGGYPICVIEKIKEPALTDQPGSTVHSFDCGGKATLIATLLAEDFAQVRIAQQGQPELTFSGILSPSGSGAKYVSGDRRYTFWTKGETCMVIENEGGADEKTLFKDCKTVK